MATLYTHKDGNIAKTWTLMFLFFVSVIALGWGASWYFGNQSILVASVAIAIVMNIGSYWFSDKLVLSMSGAKEADPREYRDLHNMIENLSITAGLPKPKVFVMQESAPNAFATGRNPKHAVVAVTTGLLALLDKQELEGVLAHELSHIGNRDMLVMTVAVVLVGFVTLLSDFFLRASMFGGDRENKAGALFAIVGFLLAFLAPIVGTLMQLAISRRREFLADASGALLTRYPEGLASALQKIASHGHPMQKANHATAHLFIANPFGPGKVRGALNKLFSTHPPVEERVKALLGK